MSQYLSTYLIIEPGKTFHHSIPSQVSPPPVILLGGKLVLTAKLLLILLAILKST